MGKLSYGYKKLTSQSKDGPICAACDITHGGLHLDETAGWKEAKQQIAKEGGLEIKQLHRDELDDKVCVYWLFLPLLLLLLYTEEFRRKTMWIRMVYAFQWSFQATTRVVWKS